MPVSEQKNPFPGPVVLFGSGETSPSGRKVFDQVFSRLPHAPRIALLETPAGFELNSDRVIGRVAEFMEHRLQNYEPRPVAVPARKKGTSFSPDDPVIIDPIYLADLIFMGPGSPSYAVRQLQDSLAWQAILARHSLGITLAFASAAVVAVGAYALPVYEIYKAGEDLHWKPGLDLFGRFGLPLVFIPHWNNNDGGEELDTSRCFMGQARFQALMELLPPELTVIGIDEKTALTIDFSTCSAHVSGLSGVTLIHTGHKHSLPESDQDLNGTGLETIARQRHSHVHQYQSGESFSLQDVGCFTIPEPGDGLPAEVYQRALSGSEPAEPETGDGPPAQVLALAQERQAARLNKEWAKADQMREEIAALGWQVKDTPQGPVLSPGDSAG